MGIVKNTVISLIVLPIVVILGTLFCEVQKMEEGVALAAVSIFAIWMIWYTAFSKTRKNPI